MTLPKWQEAEIFCSPSYFFTVVSSRTRKGQRHFISFADVYDGAIYLSQNIAQTLYFFNLVRWWMKWSMLLSMPHDQHQGRTTNGHRGKHLSWLFWTLMMWSRVMPCFRRNPCKYMASFAMLQQPKKSVSTTWLQSICSPVSFHEFPDRRWNLLSARYRLQWWKTCTVWFPDSMLLFTTQGASVSCINLSLSKPHKLDKSLWKSLHFLSMHYELFVPSYSQPIHTIQDTTSFWKKLTEPRLQGEHTSWMFTKSL